MDCSDKSLSELFTSKLIIPDYQRPYAWSSQQVEQFFSDLVQFINRDDPEYDDFYLFGQIIIHSDNGRRNVVDGQQRLTTSTIFLCVVRDIILNRYPNNLMSLLNKVYNSIGFDDEDDGFRLELSNFNQEFFREYVQCSNHYKEAKSRSNILIKDAYQCLNHLVLNYIDNFEDPQQALKHLTDNFLQNFHVSYVETKKLSQAFVIFETLNSRGMPLDVQDLLKNYFFSRLGDKWPYIKNNWIKMMTDISEVKGDLSQCIRYYWNSKNLFVRDDDLFPAISKEKNINKIKSTFDEIVETSALYIEMISPRIGGSFTDRSVEALANLRTMSATSFFPLIFALKSEKNDDDIIEAVLVQIETMVFRNQAIMKKTANKNEVFFSRTAEAVSRGELSATEVMQNIASNTSNDIEVEAAFKGYKTKSTMVGRMILTSLYNHEHPELKINSGRAVHIEHIMPQTKGMWNIDDDTWIEYKDRIGNMVLLDGKKNISASNDLFDQKKERYLKSDIIDTREIAKYDKWGPEEIDERQSELLKKVLLRWPKYNQN